MKTKYQRLGTLAIVLLICTAPVAFGATTAAMKFVNGGNNAVLGVDVNPYTVSIDGVNTQAICDDFADDTYTNETWTANVSTVANLGSGIRWTSAQEQANYDQAAWLAIQLFSASAQTQQYISFAIWSLFDPTDVSTFLANKGLTGVNLAAGAVTWRGLAVAGALTLSQADLALVNVYSVDRTSPILCSGGPCPTAPPQEFLTVKAPEAEVAALLGVDLLGLGGLVLFFRRRAIGRIQ